MKEKDSIKQPAIWLGYIPSLLALSSFGAVVMSVTHELGYFDAVAPQLQTLISPTDYLANAILWLPQNVVILVVAVVLVRTVWGWFSRNSENEAFMETSNNALVITVNVLVVLFVITAAVYMFVAAIKPALIMACPLLLAAILARLANNGYMRQTEGFKVVVFGLLGSTFLGEIYFWGEAQAARDLRGFENVYRIVMRGSVTPINAVLLRSLDKGVLIHDPVRARVELLRWDDVKSISVESGNVLYRTSPACRWFGVYCRSPNVLP